MRSTFSGAGNSPALSGSCAFTAGPAGIAAPGPRVDADADAHLTIDDLYAWHLGLGQRDVDADGAVTDADARAILHQLRQGERRSLLSGRP